MTEPLNPQHGGYRKLKSFQVSEVVCDLTVRFCDRWINPRSRTHDQMVQAARSGRQNSAEGSQDSATSKKMELKLTQVARGSLEELKLDYEDYLEIAANGALALITVATALLDRQVATLAKQFSAEGGFTERLYRVRSEQRRHRIPLPPE